MSKKEKNDQIPTPVVYVRKMLDSIGYTHNLFNKRILENSCGDGNVLEEIVRRYIADARMHNIPNGQIVVGLEEDIIAYEIDQNCIEICKQRLDEVCNNQGLPKVHWNIINDNFLSADFTSIQADFIVGNPPYATYHDIPVSERTELKEKYSVCAEGRFDYCYAFIQASIFSLSANGKLVYLIPFSIFRNKSANELRKFMKAGLLQIIDLSNENVFPDIMCSTAILLFQNNSNQAYIEYMVGVDSVPKRIDKKSLDEEDRKKWIFSQEHVKGKRFGDYFQVKNSVATLCNEAFLFIPDQSKLTDSKYYFADGAKIEKAVCYIAESTRSSKTKEKAKEKKSKYIIFPYVILGNTIGKYQEDDFKDSFPEAYKYLLGFREKLDKKNEGKDENKKCAWYEYGKTQGLTSIFSAKLIIPMVMTREARVYIADKNTIPYAGYYITVRQQSEYSLDKAKSILEDPAFYKYVKSVGTPTTEHSYRISVNDISEYYFD